MVDKRPLTQYRDSTGMTWIAGKPGAVFTLSIYNRTSARILAVVTIDGLNIIDGSQGSVDGPGYIVGSFHDPLRIDGWRRGDHNAAQFVFADSKGSYAVQTGNQPDNLGIIGVAIFEEKAPKPVYRDLLRILESNRGDSEELAFGATKGLSPSLGTGYGDEISSRVRSTEFRHADRPVEILSLRYATEEELRARGIIANEPNPFPADKPEATPTVPAPPGWPQKKALPIR